MRGERVIQIDDVTAEDARARGDPAGRPPSRCGACHALC